MTLGTVKDMIRTELNRGTLYDASIEGYLRQAALWFERNYTMKYMERFVEFTIDPESAEPRALPFPETPKSLKFFRIQRDDGRYWYLKKIEPVAVGNFDITDIPHAYWLDGVDYIWLDRVPDQEYTAEMSYVRYTTWPTDDAATNWLLIYGEDWLMSRTIYLMGGRIRNPALADIHKQRSDEALRTLILSDEELRHENEDRQMDYGRIYD